jgi:LysM repeat protein
MGRNRWGIACGLAAATLAMAANAEAAVPHVVQPGETLWSIAAANNFTTRTVAAFNGLPEDGPVIVGSTIQIPTVDEGAATLAAAAPAPATAAPAAASGGAGHVVQPGETLWSIAVANNLTTGTIAAFNGIAEEALLVAGTTIQIPSEADGAAAVAAAGVATTPAATETASAYGLAYVPSPYGDLPLDPAAAASWNSMRSEALASYGVDLYPGGTVSAYRTYDQQAELYDLFLSGAGAPANPPGTSSHELGVAVDLATTEMRSVVDAIGPTYGWYAAHDDEWWHVEYWG